MKRLTGLLLLLSAVCFAQNKTYSIKGTIQNASADYLYIVGENFIDSAKIIDDKYKFKGNLTRPREIRFATKNTARSEDSFYLENSDYKAEVIVIPELSTVKFRIFGESKTQQLKNEFASFYESNYDQKDFRHKVYNKLDSLISAYPKNPLTGELLAAVVEQGGILTSFETINLLNKIDLKFQNKSYITDIQDNIKKYEKFKIGSKLPTIILPNKNDNMVEISKSNAKLTFIEFWFVG